MTHEHCPPADSEMIKGGCFITQIDRTSVCLMRQLCTCWGQGFWYMYKTISNNVCGWFWWKVSTAVPVTRLMANLGDSPKQSSAFQHYMKVSWNRGTPKSSIGCSITNHPFWGTPMTMDPPIWLPCWENHRPEWTMALAVWGYIVYPMNWITIPYNPMTPH